MDDFVVRSVTVSVVIEDDGSQAITYNTEGDPADWEVLGMLDYAASVIRNCADLEVGIEDDE